MKSGWLFHALPGDMGKASPPCNTELLGCLHDFILLLAAPGTAWPEKGHLTSPITTAVVLQRRCPLHCHACACDYSSSPGLVVCASASCHDDEEVGVNIDTVGSLSHREAAFADDHVAWFCGITAMKLGHKLLIFALRCSVTCILMMTNRYFAAGEAHHACTQLPDSSVSGGSQSCAHAVANVCVLLEDGCFVSTINVLSGVAEC